MKFCVFFSSYRTARCDISGSSIHHACVCEEYRIILYDSTSLRERRQQQFRLIQKSLDDNVDVMWVEWGYEMMIIMSQFEISL